MDITFRAEEPDLILTYVPDIEYMRAIVIHLSKGNTFNLKKTFHLELDNLLSQYSERIELLGTEQSDYMDYDDMLSFDKLEFRIGKYTGDYVFLNQSVFGIQHEFCFSKDINLKARLFVADHNISIPEKISNVFNSDIFIGGDETHPGFISFSDYELLVKKFPTSAELKHYSNSRVELILSDYFDNKYGFTQKYQKFISRRKSFASSSLTLDNHARFESSAIYQSTLHKLEQFTLLLNDFRNNLFTGTHSESFWQAYIHKVILMIYPKYIMASREITLNAINEIEDPYQRRPDFILIDTNGFVDVMDIKIPEVPVISAAPSYRNNHVPSKAFSSAIQQVEKYVYCLNQRAKENADAIQTRVSAELPADIIVRVLNPLGLLIIGRSSELSSSQLRDFELVKRQYKHLVEILTYDDILARLQNIVRMLERDLN